MQSHPQKVHIIGRSLLLDSVRAALQHQVGIELMPAFGSVDSSVPDLETLVRLHPDVILCTDAANLPAWQARLSHLPAVSLIALDSANQEALLYHGEIRRVVTPKDLVQLILATNGVTW